MAKFGMNTGFQNENNSVTMLLLTKEIKDEHFDTLSVGCASQQN